MKGKSSELHEALAGEMAARRVDQQELQQRQTCKDCAEERRQKSELLAECQRLRTEVMEFEAVKIQMQRLRSNHDRMRDQLVDDMKALIAHHSNDLSVTHPETSPREARPARPQPSVFAADVLPDDFSSIARGKKRVMPGSQTAPKTRGTIHFVASRLEGQRDKNDKI